MKDMIKVVVANPFAEPFECMVKNSLEQYYDIIGCDYVEAIYPFENSSVVGYIDEEGKLNGKLPNMIYFNDVVCGTIIFLGTDDEGNDKSLTDEEIKMVKEHYKKNVLTDWFKAIV